jgi:hypothetical protein
LLWKNVKNNKIPTTCQEIIEFRHLVYDALPSHGVKPLEGFTKSSCGKLRLGGTLPASNSKKG